MLIPWLFGCVSSWMCWWVLRCFELAATAIKRGSSHEGFKIRWSEKDPAQEGPTQTWETLGLLRYVTNLCMMLGRAWDMYGTWACWCHAFERLGSSVVCTSSAFCPKEQIYAMHRAFPYHPMMAQNHLRSLVWCPNHCSHPPTRDHKGIVWFWSINVVMAQVWKRSPQLEHDSFNNPSITFRQSNMALENHPSILIISP